MVFSKFERMICHIGIEIWSKLFLEAAVRKYGQWT